MIRFWNRSKSGLRGRPIANSSLGATVASAADSLNVEGEFGQAHQPTPPSQRRTTTAEVTGVAPPSMGSLRGSRKGSVRLTSAADEKDAVRASSTVDQSVQTSDELLQPLIGNGLRQRRRPAAAEDDDQPPSAHDRDSLDDLACRPWRRHSLTSLNPLSPRLASPVDDQFQTDGAPLPPAAVPQRDLILDDVLGHDVSPCSLSPLSIAEMTSPPRRWRRFELAAPRDASFPLRCYDADLGRRRDGHHAPPRHVTPNYVVGLPPSLVEDPPPQRAPLRRQKPYFGGVAPSTGLGRARGVDVVGSSPASTGSSGGGGRGGDDGGDSSEGAGAKSLSTASLEDAISRSMSRLSDDDDVIRRGQRMAAVPRHDVTGMGRSSGVTSRRPRRPVVLSSDV